MASPAPLPGDMRPTRVQAACEGCSGADAEQGAQPCAAVRWHRGLPELCLAPQRHRADEKAAPFPPPPHQGSVVVLSAPAGPPKAVHPPVLHSDWVLMVVVNFLHFKINQLRNHGGRHQVGDRGACWDTCGPVQCCPWPHTQESLWRLTWPCPCRTRRGTVGPGSGPGQPVPPWGNRSYSGGLHPAGAGGPGGGGGCCHHPVSCATSVNVTSALWTGRAVPCVCVRFPVSGPHLSRVGLHPARTPVWTLRLCPYRC